MDVEACSDRGSYLCARASMAGTAGLGALKLGDAAALSNAEPKGCGGTSAARCIKDI